MFKKIYLELTDSCNLNCVMCFRAAWSKTTQDMREDTFRALSQQLPALTELKTIVIGGIGEPFGAPLFCEALNALKHYHITITTNGTLLTAETYPLLCDTTDVIVVSIDGVGDTFERIRGTSLQSIITNIKGLNSYKEKHKRPKPAVHIQFVLHQENLSDVYEVIALAASLKCQRFILSQLIPQTSQQQESILYQRAPNRELKELFLRLINHGRRKGIYVDLPNAEIKTERRCNFVSDRALLITSQGEMTPCFRLAHDGEEIILGRRKQVFQHSFGNIVQQSLKELSTNRRYREFWTRISNHHYPSCIDCDLVDGCDLVRNTEMDCYGGEPACSDCLWSRRFAQCP